MKCVCGGTYIHMDDSESLFCDKCGEWAEDEAPRVKGSVFSEARLKPLRGVPTNTFSCGSETKGRLQIQIPINATDAEKKEIIDSAIDSLKYILDEVKRKELDIFTGRKS